MTARGLPMMPFYARDYLSATRLMTLPERGAYTDLLFYQWELGPLPNDPTRLARLLGCTDSEFEQVWPTVRSKFVEIGGALVNRKLEEHRVKSARMRDRKVLGAEIANAKRDAKRGAERRDADTLSDALSGTPPSPSPSPAPRKKLSRESEAVPELHREILDAWHKLLPGLPRVKGWPQRRRQMLDARIRELLQDGKPGDTVAYWERLFTEAVAESDFLAGRAGSFRASLDWVIRPENLLKIREGRYSNVRAGGAGVSHGA